MYKTLSKGSFAWVCYNLCSSVAVALYLSLCMTKGLMSAEHRQVK